MGLVLVGEQLCGVIGELEVMELVLEGIGKERKKVFFRKCILVEFLVKGFLQLVKFSWVELYKEFINEEFNYFWEIEFLFYFSLFCLQVEELLKEVRLLEKKKDWIDVFLWEVNQWVVRVFLVFEIEFIDQVWFLVGV